jgi:preprotein translocase subunit SecF
LKSINREFITSLLTVILAILAIALFIYSGATPLFYCTMAIALVVGFYNAWQISNIETSDENDGRKGKKSSRKRQ